jgi:membrane protease YdiL (CAAX protease family)
MGVLLTVFALVIVEYLPPIAGKNASTSIEMIFAIKTVILFILVPLALIRYVYGRPLSDFGWRLPDKWLGKSVAVLALLMPVIIVLSQSAMFVDRYSSQVSWDIFVLKNIIFLPIYYLGEEFLFRGFLFLGLSENMSWKRSMVFNGIIFASLHVMKPFPEILIAFIAAFMFCYLTYKTKSFLPSAVIHFIFGVTLNIVTYAH